MKTCHNKLTSQTDKSTSGIRLNIIIRMLLCSLISFVLPVSASEQEEASWYEIEIIVFKPTREQNFLDESWNTNIEINKPKNLIDLLNNTQKIGLNSDNVRNKKNSTAKITKQHSENYPQQASTQDNQNLGLPILDINSLEEEARQLQQLNKKSVEKPFLLLGDEFKQLSNEAESLERHPEYKVLQHIAWRQPVKNFKKSPYIRITGGIDFGESYGYTGNKHEDKKIILGESRKQNSDETLVPELDGDIKIYLKKYLHLRTNLFLRQPGKEEVKADNLSLYNSEGLSSIWKSDTQKNQLSQGSVLQDPQLKEKLNESDNKGFNNKESDNIDTENPTNTVPQQDESQLQFSWEINDNFLDMAPEKIYIEKLFNYSLKQSRKIRSNQLHYLDHPLLGLLIMIRPYERE